MKQRRRKSRIGFTLVELLVVVAIIGVLASLLLPAVQRAREAARKIACQSNLRQLAQAAHLYQEAHGTLPGYAAPYQWYGTPVGWQNRGKWSWKAELLPFLEQSPIFDALNFNGAGTNNWSGSIHHGSWSAMKTRIEVFLCPSDARPLKAYPGNNYYESNGSWYFKDSATGGIGRYDGLSDAIGVSLDNIAAQDGTSQTLMFGEQVKGSEVTGTQSEFNVMLAPGQDLHQVPWQNARDICIQMKSNWTNTSYWANQYGGGRWRGRWWHFNRQQESGSIQTIVPPNSVSCSTGAVSWLGGKGKWGKRGMNAVTSYHMDGANVVMCDASARFVSAKVDRDVWMGVGSRDRGEAIPTSF